MNAANYKNLSGKSVSKTLKIETDDQAPFTDGRVNPKACNLLPDRYIIKSNGDERVLIDPVEAFAWANAATQYGEAHAQKLLDTVAKGLTPEQLHLAQKRAAEYERKYVAPFRTY